MSRWSPWRTAACLLAGLLATTTVYGHVSGVFGDYLAGSHDAGVTQRLLDDLAASKDEMERLTPQLNDLQQEFDRKAEAAQDKLGVYQAVGMDTYLQFMLETGNPVDVLANRRLLEHELEGDLRSLEALYAEYMPVKAVRDSLANHEKLLQVLRGNLEARERTLKEAEALGPEPPKSWAERLNIGEWIGALLTEEKEIDPLTHRLDEIWSAHIGYLLELKEDGERLRENPAAFVTRKTASSPYRLEDRLLNASSPLTYYMFTDHVYVHLVRGSADLLLIGTVQKKEAGTAALGFEAGFLNGFALPEEVVGRLAGFELPYAALHPGGGDFYVEQENGAVVIQPAEFLKE
ncbi:coiled-coil domain-containing protein [Paenibacillus mucilaginosus]|uniref:Uncharacterized protein n=1 Tax=Paenibacillus mucilaginosus (strain KNP414) TaxID=1036673 RepID=F8F6R8_PAEMK|nr:hypothetical protein [Paenibacillus mucilaginosus]AEI43584.1 hypothetical protein KNP414_05060 [Paenibacillus mucilaginosus KNP414]MCG7211881.1 hypothetical protein [Paenibacillus mucilaginosus]WDM25118.1 hypothetical protein KCX80_21915 [Paenibacillus mucilaginosus]